ncbi:hypothetical protein ACJA28_00080 [Mesomycoplasma moatsii]|uniref:hypothetical protein n=1 Tax=Mesomycoplasma moatsii TaxID=171287 RepID=UPI0003B661FB
MKQKRFWNSKLFWIIIAFVFSVGLVIIVVVFKFIYTFQPSFYSYSSYVDPQTVKQINKKYTYKEYASANEFEFALENNKAIAGIGSDYSIVSLIRQGKIAPIRKEMEKLLNPHEDKLWSWENYWTEETRQQMQEYDEYLNDPKIQDFLQKQFNDPYYKEFKFSDFVVPYFINDKVIAFDTKKIWNNIDLSQEEVIQKLGLNDQNTPTLEKVLEALNTSNSNIKIQWTKNERENVVLGDTISNPKEKWNTEITENNYLEWLNNFAKIVKDGTGFSMDNTNKNLFDTDSDIILNNLINPTSKINVTMIYNGDALDAYYGHDNFQSIQDGDRVRIIRSNYTVRVLDCFVVSSSISQNEKEKLLNNFNELLFNGMFSDENELLAKDKNEFNTSGIIRIFDYVNYTPAAAGAYKYIYNNYFEDDEYAKYIYTVAKTDEKLGIYVKGIAPIEKNVLSKLTLAFQKKINGY